MKIKNLIIKPITVVLISLLLFVSCTDNAFDIGEKETRKVTISVRGETPKDLTLTPSAPAAEDINWTYTLRKTNGTNGIGQISEETKITGSSVTTAVSIGNWTAEVWGYRDATCRELVYHGTGSGDISRSGGTIAVNAVTMTDVGLAHALTPGEAPKSTADLVLMPVDVEGDENGTVRNSLEWVVGGETVSTWLWQGGAWTSGGNTVGENGVVVNVEPGNVSVVAIVRDVGGDMIAAEGWKTQEFAMNCTYTIDGIMRSDIVVINSFFDIDPSSEMPADNAMVIGYRETSKGVSSSVLTTDLSNTITFPYVLVCSNPIETPVTPSALGLEKLYVTKATDLVTSGATVAWFGRTAAVGSESSVNINIKLAEVRYVADTTIIQDYSLYRCQNIESVTLPNDVTSIGRSAFQDCTGLTSITIPKGVTEIGDYVFSSCKGLTSITISEGVASIGAWAFSSCTGLTSITIPDSVTSIGQSAFAYCSGLTNITIPNGVTEIGKSAFQDCTGLTSIKIPSSVTSIGNNAFWRCKSLTSITIPSGVTSIGNSAFENCTGLTSITISEGVASIGAWAFSSCTGLTSVTIPSSVTEIGNWAFNGCTGLTDIYVNQQESKLLDYAGIPSGCTVLWRGQF